MTGSLNSWHQKAEPFVARIERLFEDIASKRGEYMAQAKVIREDITEVYGEAKAAGIPVRALKAVVRYRALEHQQRELANGLDIDEAAAYENLRETMGDLGAAAGQAAGYGPDDAATAAAEDDDKRDLRPRFLREQGVDPH